MKYLFIRIMSLDQKEVNKMYKEGQKLEVIETLGYYKQGDIVKIKKVDSETSFLPYLVEGVFYGSAKWVTGKHLKPVANSIKKLNEGINYENTKR